MSNPQTWKIALDHAMTQADAANHRVVMALERIKRRATDQVNAKIRQARAVDIATRDAKFSIWHASQALQANDPEFRDAVSDAQFWSSEARRYAAAITAYKALGLH